MNDLARFSVYAIEPPDGGDPNPLAFLTGDRDHGWQVARNLLKPLNHLDCLRRKEEIAFQLGLHNTLTQPELFAKNFAWLEDHQRGRLATGDLIARLAFGQDFHAGKIRALLREYARPCHMEFHPTDLCSMACCGCTYGQDDPLTKPPALHFPIARLGRLLDLRPGSIVIIGGGEPTLYRSGSARIQDVVEELSNSLPDTRLALVTNGVCRPPGNWPARLDWLRISLDAATPETYQRFRGQGCFGRVIHTFLSYLDENVPWVGISFLFARSNIHEYAQVADFIYHLVLREKPHCLHKVNIQYRPLRRDPRQSGQPFNEAVTEEQIRTAVSEVIALAESSPDMRAFLRDQTNITAVLGGSAQPEYAFSRCFYSQTFKIARASGDLRPCFIHVTEPEFRLGSLLSDSLETIALNTLYVGAKPGPDCSPAGCRQCHVNAVFEAGLAGRLKPSESKDVRADPMY